jgi:hypothetical protein
MTTYCSGHRCTLPGLLALAGIAFTLMFAATAAAQVVSDPRIAEFDPSPDHWQSLESGEPAVVRYELGMYMLGAASPFATVDMGKPSPGADGKIRYDFASGVAGWPLTGGYYEARVSAVGPEGAALSDPSNPFTFGTASSCAISLGATTIPAPASGGSYGVQVSTGTACAWTAATSLSWVTVWTSGGSGSGTVPFAVQSNPTTSSRSGTITIGGRTLTIRQDGLAGSPAAYQLTVSRPSGGTVYSAGINCGTTGTACQVAMPASMSIGLQAAPAAGYAFSGWTGDCRGTYPSFTLQLDGQRSCGATFTAVSATGATSTTGGSSAPPPDANAPPLGGPYTLTVARPSGGVVKAAGIVCGTGVTVCAVGMPGPMTIGLQATADPGYAFAGWAGHCAGSSPSYSLALEGPRTCGATFIAAR